MHVISITKTMVITIESVVILVTTATTETVITLVIKGTAVTVLTKAVTNVGKPTSKVPLFFFVRV